MKLKDLELPENTGVEMYRLVERLYPICRSITGNGVRETLRILQEEIPLEIREVPTGTPVFDWEVPREWNINSAWIKNSRGETIIDFANSNLHVLNYSIPVRKTMNLDELKGHIFTDPGHPDWIPYRTSYYVEKWGFCMSHKQFLSLVDDTYEVCIDSCLEAGHLTYGEYYIKGQNTEEILISTHICHPSLCNDGLSGIAIASFLARQLNQLDTRYSYRFLFIPGTIGSITWLALNEEKIKNFKQGLVLSLLGDSGGFTYKKTRNGECEIDYAVQNVLKYHMDDFEIRSFSPYGYDERQYASPGINIPMGCLMRSPYGEFEEYHMSADNLDFVQPDNLAQSLNVILKILFISENNHYYGSRNPMCEPQLGRRGLYNNNGGSNERDSSQLAQLWVLNQSDGDNSLLDIARKADLDFDIIFFAAFQLEEVNLIYKMR